MREEQYFRQQITEAKEKLQQLSPDQFDNLVDYNFRKAVLEAEMQAYSNTMVDYKKFVKDSSEEDAAIIMHKHLKTLSDKHREELGKVEKYEHQEDEKITADRGRLNGLIDGYNAVRIHFDALTSVHAAEAQRALNRK